MFSCDSGKFCGLILLVLLCNESLLMTSYFDCVTNFVRLVSYIVSITYSSVHELF